MRLYKCLIYLVIFFLLDGGVFANTSNDAFRDSLINSIKNNYNELQDVNLVVKKIEYLDNYGYFCGIGLDSTGSPLNSNYFVAVYDMLMQRSSDGQWKQIVNFNSFSPPNAKVTCYLSEGIKSFLPKISQLDDVCISINKNGPERKNILDAIRMEKEQSFVVTRLCKTTNMAYFCGASLDKKTGFIDRTGNVIDIYNVILRKNPDGRWTKVVSLGNFALALDNITCLFGNESVILQSAILQDAASKLKDD
ncbi:hypothetical protein [Serratia oryzae]|uniref:Uncharacterized protein n=1 Tax=Serratia oryzae TaxID=2034155 RepID=A0A1S8CJE1_9GAMM|nr:hypothetical protein [Serratia oryzae]OMQ21475.1 hypothetical protein BMI79_15465 [Serratia oryzae]